MSATEEDWSTSLQRVWAHGMPEAARGDPTAQLSQSLLKLIDTVVQDDPDMDSQCRQYVAKALAADRPAWSAAARAVWAIGLGNHEDEESAYLQLVLAELELQRDRDNPRPHPPGGPTGINAAHNNLGVAYVFMRAFELGLPHFRRAVAESDAHYAAGLWIQHLLDHENLSESCLRWALHLQAMGHAEAALRAAGEAAQWAQRFTALGEQCQRLDAVALGTAILIGARSIAAPDTLSSADALVMQQICRAPVFGDEQTAPLAWTVLSRVCRLIGDPQGCLHAASVAEGMTQAADRSLLMFIAREVALLDPQDSPAWGYAWRMSQDAESARVRSVASFRTRLALASLQERYEQVTAARAHLQDQLEAATAAQEQWIHSATHDDLTGLPNRMLFMQRLSALLPNDGIASTAFAVGFVDVDDLKAINDGHGHQAGDECLRQVAAVLVDSIRTQDTVARLSGDEFAVLLIAEDQPPDASRWASDLAALLRDRGQSVSVGVCVVAAGMPASAEHVMAVADAEMYEAKRCGKGHARVTTLAVEGWPDAR